MRTCIVIGCGWAGAHHLGAIAASPHARLVAAVEPNPARAAELEPAYRVPVFESLEALEASGAEYDTAVVATLPHLHLADCLRLVRQGKDVLCEKPVCRTAEEIDELRRAVEQAGTRFGVVFNQRYGGAVQKAKQLLARDGTPVHLLTASMYQHWPTKTGGHIGEDFMLTDACCHLLDLATYLGGPVARTQAVGRKLDSELYSDMAALLEFEGGGIGVISHSNVGGKLDTQHPFQHMDIHTARARYRVENQWDRLVVYPHDGEAAALYETSVFQPRQYAQSLHTACGAFLQALEEKTALPAGLEDAARNMQTLQAIIEAIHQTQGKRGTT